MIRLVVGIWMSAFALGNFVGPTLAGFIVQNAGFPNTTLLFFCLYAVMLVIDALSVIYYVKYFTLKVVGVNLSFSYSLD